MHVVLQVIESYIKKDAGKSIYLSICILSLPLLSLYHILILVYSPPSHWRITSCLNVYVVLVWHSNLSELFHLSYIRNSYVFLEAKTLWTCYCIFSSFEGFKACSVVYTRWCPWMSLAGMFGLCLDLCSQWLSNPWIWLWIRPFLFIYLPPPACLHTWVGSFPDPPFSPLLPPPVLYVGVINICKLIFEMCMMWTCMCLLWKHIYIDIWASLCFP